MKPRLKPMVTETNSLPFGRYEGIDISDVPDSYLIYLLESDWFDKKYPHLVKKLDEEIAYRDKWDKHIF